MRGERAQEGVACGQEVCVRAQEGGACAQARDRRELGKVRRVTDASMCGTANAVLVLNNSKVVEARLAAFKQGTKGKAEVMLLSPVVSTSPAGDGRSGAREAGAGVSRWRAMRAECLVLRKVESCRRWRVAAPWVIAVAQGRLCWCAALLPRCAMTVASWYATCGMLVLGLAGLARVRPAAVGRSRPSLVERVRASFMVSDDQGQEHQGGRRARVRAYVGFPGRRRRTRARGSACRG